MAERRNAPGAGITEGAVGVSRSGSADIPSHTDDSAGLQDMQAAILAQRHGLTPAVARRVVEQAFGAGGAR